MRELRLPVDMKELVQVRAYDQLLLSGELYVGRDQVHSRLASLIKAKGRLPFDLNGQAIYYMGPSPAPEGRVIGSCGPTTSARMDPFAPLLLDQGLKVMVGKGPRNQSVVDAIVRNQALYLQAFGGCGALYASCVKKMEIVGFPELGPEALLRLEIEHFPVIVAIDSQGGSVFSR